MNMKSLVAYNHEFWFEFIDLYKENRCLWDIEDSIYVRRDLRNIAYNVLLQKYQEVDPTATVETVKKKIDILRTGYRREVRKIEKSIRDGATQKDMYKPTLWYFDRMSFIKLKNQDQIEEISFSDIEEEVSESERDHEATFEYIDIPIDQSMPSKSPKKILSKKRKFIKSEDVSETVEDASSTFSYKIEDTDDISTYCASLKLQMRELDTEQKYIAQKLISDVIFLARTSQLTLNSSVKPK